MKTKISLGGKNTFAINKEAELLSEDECEVLHTVVARLLYLSKIARPDIMTVTIYVCTRVKASTVEDVNKLERVLGYLKATKQKKLHLRLTGLLSVEAYST